MSGITTRVLDAALGRPPAGVPVRLEQLSPDKTETFADVVTDDDGRCGSLGPDQPAAGTYRLTSEPRPTSPPPARPASTPPSE